MNPDKIRTALNTLAVGLGELSEALTMPVDDLPSIPEPVAVPQPSLSDESVDFLPEGSLEVCPKHKTPYKDGRYGPFCTNVSDDPAWSNSKGYCTITPKNAAQYLRIKAA
jgi:hypothetical protein